MCLELRIVSAYWRLVVSVVPQLHYCQERDPVPILVPRFGLDGCGKYRPPSPGFDHRIIQPIALCYTDYAIPAHNVVSFVENCVRAVLLL
jgi:hypothetical protein